MKTTRGFFIFFEWIDALETMPAKTAMKILCNIRRYITEGVEPEPLTGQAGMVQNFMLNYQKRSLAAARGGRKRAQMYRDSLRATEQINSDEAEDTLTMPPVRAEDIPEGEGYLDYLFRTQGDRWDEKVRANNAHRDIP